MSNKNPEQTDFNETFQSSKLPCDQESRIDHGLCLLWTQQEKKDYTILRIKDILRREIDAHIYDDLVSGQLIIPQETKVEFTKEGSHIARDIIRRRRLAERLLEDVLEVSRSEVDSQASEFEHVIDKNVEESICTLLGHPRECPHGFPIPSGQCCQRSELVVESIVASLDQFTSGEMGKVAYILTRNHPQLHKLMSLGIVPGILVHIHQTYPSYIIKVEETQLALEKEVAQNIYLRKIQD
jgi:DtxR family transcriptional regulator, Mn-dependent transcriptional regulator